MQDFREEEEKDDEATIKRKEENRKWKRLGIKQVLIINKEAVKVVFNDLYAHTHSIA